MLKIAFIPALKCMVFCTSNLDITTEEAIRIARSYGSIQYELANLERERNPSSRLNLVDKITKEIDTLRRVTPPEIYSHLKIDEIEERLQNMPDRTSLAMALNKALRK